MLLLFLFYLNQIIKFKALSTHSERSILFKVNIRFCFFFMHKTYCLLGWIDDIATKRVDIDKECAWCTIRFTNQTRQFDRCEMSSNELEEGAIMVGIRINCNLYWRIYLSIQGLLIISIIIIIIILIENQWFFFSKILVWWWFEKRDVDTWFDSNDGFDLEECESRSSNDILQLHCNWH